MKHQQGMDAMTFQDERTEDLSIKLRKNLNNQEFGAAKRTIKQILNEGNIFELERTYVMLSKALQNGDLVYIGREKLNDVAEKYITTSLSDIDRNDLHTKIFTETCKTLFKSLRHFKEFDKAIDIGKKVIDKYPELAIGYIELAWSYSMKADSEEINNKDESIKCNIATRVIAAAGVAKHMDGSLEGDKFCGKNIRGF